MNMLCTAEAEAEVFLFPVSDEKLTESVRFMHVWNKSVRIALFQDFRSFLDYGGVSVLEVNVGIVNFLHFSQSMTNA